jgi:hypothetical protein
MLKHSFAIWSVALAIGAVFARPAIAQSPPDIQAVLERLDKLEAENSRLQDEIQELRTELTAASKATAPAQTPGPPPDERLDVQENRTAELDQSKVGTSQRFPVSLTGMLLFNAFRDGHYGGTAEYPAVAALSRAPGSDGASLRQTVLGLKFNGPDLPGGGKASGSLYMDFFGGTSSPNNNLLRIRIATLDLTWKNTTISVGQDKPIISPREPTSLAQVGISPLTGAGNLWDWNPQVRIEQRFSLGDNSGLRAQAGVYETAENYPESLPPAFAGTLESSRPSFESRLEYFHDARKWRLEIAPGYHGGTTHVAGSSLQSQIASLDWMIRLAPQVEFSGEAFRGKAVSGLGALPGFNVSEQGVASPVHSNGEWGQIALFPASRLSFHIYSGEQANRSSDVAANGITRNFVLAGNLIYKFAPNVRAALEASQARTDYLGSGLRTNIHYDLAIAYLF